MRWPLYDLQGGSSWFVEYMTIYLHDFESADLNKSNEPKITQIGQIEAEILAIVIFGSKPMVLYRKYMFFDFSSIVAADSSRHVKFINIHKKTMTLGGICIIYPQSLFFLDA